VKPVLLALCLFMSGCGVKTDLITYEAYEAEQKRKPQATEATPKEGNGHEERR